GPMSTVQGAFQTVPTIVPLMRTSATSPTLPRSSRRGVPAFHSFGASKLEVQVEMPEKYLTPWSWLSLSACGPGTVIDAGAPRPDWRATVQDPPSVPAVFQLGRATVFEAACAGFRNTT